MAAPYAVYRYTRKQPGESSRLKTALVVKNTNKKGRETMTERRLINDYFHDWNFSENEKEESVIFTYEGKKHKIAVRCGTNYPFIIFQGKRYYIY